MYNDNHLLLMKKNNGKIAVKFISAKPKVKPPRSLWIPKALVTHIKAPKLLGFQNLNPNFLCVGELQGWRESLDT
jgi:hypothetical protein